MTSVIEGCCWTLCVLIWRFGTLPKRSMAYTATLNHRTRRAFSAADRSSDPLADFFRSPLEVIQTPLAAERPNRHSFEHTPADAGQLLNRIPPGDSKLRWPVDAAQVIHNLRHERYAVRPQIATSTLLSSESAREVYYRLRPALHSSLKRRLQRIFLRDWETIPFPKWPVDTSVEQILEKLLIHSIRVSDLEKIPFIWFWPDGASATTIVTHDVETDAGLAFIPNLIDIDESFDIRSSFQLVPEGRYNVPTTLIDNIRKRHCEVNVHDLDHSGNLFGNRDRFLKKSKRINRYLAAYGADGFRAGSMYRNVDWYDQLRISYDMSVPNVAHLEPQRGGCCTVFPYFIGNVLELPLTTIQDYSLLNVLGIYSIDLWKAQVDLVLKRNGLLAFIVHPDYIRAEPALNVYKSLLTHLTHLRRENQLWFARPGAVNRWWRERNAMELVWEGGKWHILAPAANVRGSPSLGLRTSASYTK